MPFFIFAVCHLYRFCLLASISSRRYRISSSLSLLFWIFSRSSFFCSRLTSACIRFFSSVAAFSSFCCGCVGLAWTASGFGCSGLASCSGLAVVIAVVVLLTVVWVGLVCVADIVRGVSVLAAFAVGFGERCCQMTMAAKSARAMARGKRTLVRSMIFLRLSVCDSLKRFDYKTCSFTCKGMFRKRGKAWVTGCRWKWP